MFKLTYMQVMNTAMIETFSILMAHKGFPIKVSYHIGRIAEKLDQAAKQIREEYTALAKKHGVLEADGTPVKDLSPEVTEAWKKITDEFHEETITINKYKINISDIESIGLTPQQILSISAMVDGLSEEELS